MVGIQQLIDHIKTAQDVDPWAQDLAEELLQSHIPVKPKQEFSGSGVTWWNVCGVCKTAINPNDKFCHECGKAVEWE